MRGSETVLLLIDLQRAVDDASWGPRNNLEAELNVARLLTAWRSGSWPIIHVRHDSMVPHSTYRPGQIGNEFKPEARPIAGEKVVAKHTNSAFIGTELEALLRAQGCPSLVVVGVSSSNSVEATVRMAGNLGFETYLVADASFTFDKIDWHGRNRTADEVHAMSLANLDGEYCRVVATEWILQRVKV